MAPTLAIGCIAIKGSFGTYEWRKIKSKWKFNWNKMKRNKRAIFCSIFLYVWLNMLCLTVFVHLIFQLIWLVYLVSLRVTNLLHRICSTWQAELTWFDHPTQPPSSTMLLAYLIESTRLVSHPTGLCGLFNLLAQLTFIVPPVRSIHWPTTAH